MTTSTSSDILPGGDSATGAPSGGSQLGAGRANPAKLVIGVLGMAVVAWLAANLFLAFAYYPGWFFNSKLLIGVLALVAGVGGAWLLFYFLNMAVDALPRQLSLRTIPYAYVLPALGLIVLMLLYPTIQTINYSLANADSTEYVGLQNFRSIFGDSEFWISITNNLLWLAIVPLSTVVIGIIVATLGDRLSERGEKIAKGAIFLPMAISFVGASAIWTLVYNFRPQDRQTGLLNAIWTFFGGSAQPWLDISSGRLNSLLLMVILIWLQSGFAMILLSSAIKGVPEDTLEAARIDGANELQIFFRVIIPQIKGTIITVFITVLILVLKVFDIVYVLKGPGRDRTNVIANMFFTELFANDQAGRAAAIVVVLLVAILPVLIYQVKHFRDEEANR